MLLEYDGEDRFSFQSFPITLSFIRREGLVNSVKVDGNYDWGLCGLTVNKCIDTK